MISNSKAFERLKLEQQRILDFAVLVCHSVPNVKKTLKGQEENIPYFSLPKPDYFNKTNDDRIRELSKHYKENLSKYLIISSFSFFEAYFKAVVEELIEFQGGRSKFIESAKNRHKQIIENLKDETIKNKRKLQEPAKKKNHILYEKHIKLLHENADFRMPSELFASLGVKYVMELIGSERFRSALIPELLEFGFLMDLEDKVNQSPDLKDKSLKDTFNSMRDLRNRISHGDNPEIDFGKAMDYIRFLRDLAVRIDKHLVEHFFVLEKSK